MQGPGEDEEHGGKDWLQISGTLSKLAYPFRFAAWDGGLEKGERVARRGFGSVGIMTFGISHAVPGASHRAG